MCFQNFDTLWYRGSSSSRLQCLSGANHMSGRGIPKKERDIRAKNRKIRDEGDGNHRRHGTAILYEACGNGPTLVHGDGKLYGKGKLQEEGEGELPREGKLQEEMEEELDGEREVHEVGEVHGVEEV